MKRSRMAATALVATLCLACSNADPPGSPPGDAPESPPENPPAVHAMEEGQFRIVTWNIRFFPEPGTDVDRTAEYLVALDADVVAVQEIANRNALASLLAQVNGRLAELPPRGNRPVRSYDFVLAASGGHGGQYVGFIYDANAVDLSAIETLQRLQMTPDLRPGLYARVTSLRGGTDFHVIVVHSDSGTADRDYQNRLRFLDSLSVEVADRRPQDDDIVVLGDLNTMGRAAGGGLPAVSAEQEIADLDGVIAGMALRRLQNLPACTEYYRGEGSLLDHVLTTTVMDEIPASPVARVVGYCAEAQCRQLDQTDMPYDYAHVSDHCPVVLDFEDVDAD